MKGVRHLLGRDDHDGMGLQVSVRRVAHRVAAALPFEIHMDDLVRGMDAGIRPPGAMDPHGVTRETLDRLLHHLLHRPPVDLPLPPGEGRAVVFDDELVARHQPSSAKAAGIADCRPPCGGRAR